MTNLKRIIDEKGVQQRWLAEQIGVTEVSMSRYVSGERIPKAPIAIRMADVLGVDVKELYGWEPETHKERTETHACDCIERQAVIDVLHGYFDGMLETDTWSPCVVFGLIENLPSAQPEIVHCKDCKHYIKSESYCDYLGITISDHDFCSFAERSTDERYDKRSGN